MTTPNETTRKLDNQAPHLDYYPHWLDNLADDVVLQGAVFNGELRGAEQVGKMLSFARSLYAFQDFRFYGMRGDLFLEDYRSRIRGSEAYHPSAVEIYNFVVVYFNDAGKTSQLVMNHRPQSAPCCSRRCWPSTSVMLSTRTSSTMAMSALVCSIATCPAVCGRPRPADLRRYPSRTRRGSTVYAGVTPQAR